MKKRFWVFIALVLLTGMLAVFPACAEQEAAPELFDLWDYGGESMTWLASAVPVYEGCLLASRSVIPETADQLAVSDGVNTWQVEAAIPDESGLLTVLFYNATKAAPAAGPWSLVSYGDSCAVSSCYVRCADSQGSRINREVLAAEESLWNDRRCLLLNLSGPVPAGSPVLTEDGLLAGIVAAEWAEGENRVVALPPEEVYASLYEVLSLLDYLPDWSEAPDGLAVALDKNTVTFDWSAMILEKPPEGEKWYLVFTDTGNSYLTYFQAEEEQSFTTVLTPGRFYAAGMMTSADTPDTMPEKLLFFFVPYAQRLTEHEFKPVITAIAQKPSETRDPVPVSSVTEELLRSGEAYFYSASSYRVEEEISGLSLLVTLTDPEGVNYRWISGWVYMPEYMTQDIWFVTLREMGLTDSLDQNGYPDGAYKVAYYVNGDLADSFEFTLGTGE